MGRRKNPCCARYKGNLGLMEMFKFYEIATDEQKEHMEKLIYSGQNPAAWEYLQKVTGMELEPVDWGENQVQKWFRKLIAKFRSEP